MGLLFIYHFVDFSEDSVFDLNSKEILALKRELDSIREAEMRAKQENGFKINPNFIDDYKGYILGMTTEEIDRLLAYRANGTWINSPEEFQEITLISDSLLNVLTPLFKFPYWVKSKSKNKSFEKKVKQSYDQKLDINTAADEQLQGIYGIGKTLSKRIIDYRSSLGGFSSDVQLSFVYGLDEVVMDRLLNEFTVKTPKLIKRMNVNNVSASDLSTIPGISFELAKRIWEYRVLHDSIKSISELKKIEGITERKLELIQLYLSLE
jgi:DNA uptake protein ComE-like DNA-binding protein